MPAFGKTDKEKLAAYLQEKYRELTGDPTITASYDTLGKAFPEHGLPALHRFKLSFPNGVALKLPNGAEAEELTEVCRSHQQAIMPLFKRAEITQEMGQNSRKGDFFREYAICCDSDCYRDEPGPLNAYVSCLDVTIATKLAEAKDPEIFNRAQAQLGI